MTGTVEFAGIGIEIDSVRKDVDFPGRPGIEEQVVRVSRVQVRAGPGETQRIEVDIVVEGREMVRSGGLGSRDAHLIHAFCIDRDDDVSGTGRGGRIARSGADVELRVVFVGRERYPVGGFSLFVHGFGRPRAVYGGNGEVGLVEVVVFPCERVGRGDGQRRRDDFALLHHDDRFGFGGRFGRCHDNPSGTPALFGVVLYRYGERSVPLLDGNPGCGVVLCGGAPRECLDGRCDLHLLRGSTFALEGQGSGFDGQIKVGGIRIARLTERDADGRDFVVVLGEYSYLAGTAVLAHIVRSHDRQAAVTFLGGYPCPGAFGYGVVPGNVFGRYRNGLCCASGGGELDFGRGRGERCRVVCFGFAGGGEQHHRRQPKILFHTDSGFKVNVLFLQGRCEIPSYYAYGQGAWFQRMGHQVLPVG